MPRRTGKKPPAHVSAADQQLFREAVGPLRRLPERAPPPRPAPPPPRAHMHARDEAEALAELRGDFNPAHFETGAELAWLRPGLPPRLLQRLRRGRYSIRDEIDLHHLNAAAARELLLEFLADAAAEGRGCVRVIHGKGRRSGPGGPVLKGLTDHALRRCPLVLAFASAPPAEGGTGAVLVLLRDA